MKIIGVDYGDSRTGLACSDELGYLARGVRTISCKEMRKTAAETAKFAEESGAGLIVVGLPKNMDNTLGFRAERTQAFIDEVGKSTKIPIVAWDERLTTVSATRFLNEKDVRGEKRKKVIDALAAEIILQSYLDRNRNNEQK